MKTSQNPPWQPPAAPGLPPPERMLRGLGVSSGIAVGPAYVVESGNFQVPEYEIVLGNKLQQRCQEAIDTAQVAEPGMAAVEIR